MLETQGPQNLTSLGQKFDNGLYLSRLSNIVALMTLEHPTRMTNLINPVGWETRIAQQDGKLDDPSTRAHIESMVIYMLFADEAGLYDSLQGRLYLH